MKKITKFLMSALCVAAIGSSMAVIGGCKKNKKTITITGSTSVEDLMKDLAGKYEESHDVRINITANGSGVGIKDSIAGRNDIAMSSRALSDDEKNAGLQEKKLCTDGIVLVTSKNCALEQVDNDQIYNLYINGTSFTDNGATISTAVGRDSASGTREAFDEKITNSDGGKSIKEEKKTYKDGVAQLDKTGGVISAIENDANNKTIGYISYGSFIQNTDKLKALNFKAYGASEYVAASQTTIKNGTYKLSRPFMIINNTNNEMSEATKGFYDWLFTSEAQSIISESGYVL